jgi:hypothetical protein
MGGLKFLVAVMSLVVLAAFVGVFAYVVIKPGQAGNEALAYVWTGVSVLVGGVVAVAYGQPPQKTWIGQLTPEKIVLAYAWAYMIVGIAAVVDWILNPTAPLLVHNAATTFLGLLLPIVSAFLKPGGQQAR